MTSLAGGTKSKKEDEPNRKVVLKRDDVTLIVYLPMLHISFQMNEFEISKTAAEKALRRNHGELKATVQQLINV